MNAMEKRLYEYPAALSRIETMKLEVKDLSSLHVQSFESGHGESHSDPVSRTASRRADMERMIVRLARRVFPVTRMLVDLEAGGDLMRQMAEILKMRYFQRKSWGEIGHILHVSESTLFRKKHELLQIVKRYL